MAHSLWFWQTHRDTKYALQLIMTKNEIYFIVVDYTCWRNAYQEKKNTLNLISRVKERNVALYWQWFWVILAKQLMNIFTFMRALFIFHWHILVLKFRLILLHENFVSDVSHHNYENLCETLTEYYFLKRRYKHNFHQKISS
jgi:hypothetical protein